MSCCYASLPLCGVGESAWQASPLGLGPDDLMLFGPWSSRLASVWLSADLILPPSLRPSVLSVSAESQPPSLLCFIYKHLISLNQTFITSRPNTTRLMQKWSFWYFASNNMQDFYLQKCFHTVMLQKLQLFNEWEGWWLLMTVALTVSQSHFSSRKKRKGRGGLKMRNKESKSQGFKKDDR